MQVIDYPDRATAATGLATAMAARLRSLLAQQPAVSLAVPGGTTPGPVFDHLCHEPLDWARVTVLLTDERWVPDDHDRSNAGLIRARLMQDRAAAGRFLPYYRPGRDVDTAAAELSQALGAQFPLSLVLLGMGADMHTASLFPGAEGLDAALAEDAPALCAIRTPNQPEPRLSLSAPALRNAGERHLVIFGEDKRTALQTARGLAPAEAPVMAVMQGGTVHWAP